MIGFGVERIEPGDDGAFSSVSDMFAEVVGGKERMDGTVRLGSGDARRDPEYKLCVALAFLFAGSFVTGLQREFHPRIWVRRTESSEAVLRPRPHRLAVMWVFSSFQFDS